MYRGVYTAAMGMLVDLTKMDTLSNNLANVETNGYKADTAVFKTYLENEIYRLKPEPENRKLQVRRIGRLEQAVVLDEVRTWLEPGAVEQTGVPTHLAIAHEDPQVRNLFFAVRVGDETLYTRNGEFIVGGDGRLVNSQGYAVLNAEGREITLPPGLGTYQVRINGRGEVYDENGTFVDRIGVFLVEDLDKRPGETNFRGQGQLAEENLYRILSGYVEKSNVNAVREMVRLIEAHRHYEVTSKAIVVHDELLNKIINTVGALR